MITIQINDPDRGESRNFADAAAAIIWLQDEIARWEKALLPKYKDSAAPFTEPLRAWRQVRDDIDGLRRRNAQRENPLDYVEDDENGALVVFDSKIGMALFFVLRKLGEDSANSAAISAEIAPGQIDWTDDASFKGVVLFDRLKLAHTGFEVAERDKSAGLRADTIDDRLGQITVSIASLDKMVSSIASTATQQR